MKKGGTVKKKPKILAFKLVETNVHKFEADIVIEMEKGEHPIITKNRFGRTGPLVELSAAVVLGGGLPFSNLSTRHSAKKPIRKRYSPTAKDDFQK